MRRTCWVDGDTAVKVSLGGAHLDSHTEALQHFVGSITKDVKADDLLVRPSTDNFVRGLSLLFCREHGVEEAARASGVSV